MNYRLIISDSAQSEIEKAIDYIAVRLNNTAAAMAVLADIEEIYKEIEYMPESFSFCSDPLLFKNEYRKAVLKKHDYVLIFRIDGELIKIYGFFHTLENYIDKII